MNIIETAWNWNSGLSRRSSTEYIALHHAEASKCTAQQIDDWHKSNGWSGIGYHFFVRKDGTIYRGRPIWAVGAHVQGMNSKSIGICAEGAYMTETMPEAQKRAIAELLDYLKANYYPNAKIVGHREIGSSNCPGDNYPLEELKNYKSLLKEDEPMTAEERKKFNALVNEVERLTEKSYKQAEEIEKLKNPMIYNYIDGNMPEWAHEGVQFCLDKGIIQGTGKGLGLNDNKLWFCTAIMRAVKFVAKLMKVQV